ncbi:hypothetical protein ACOK4R_24795 [Pseudomonas fluorescens]
MHRRRSSQDLFYQSQVIPRSQKALAGYSTENDKKNFMWVDVRIFIFLRKWHGVAGWVAVGFGGISVIWVMADIGSALTAGHFCKDTKVTKKSSPQHSVPRYGSACPQSDSDLGGRRDGPSLAQRG